MSFSPTGTARLRFLSARGSAPAGGAPPIDAGDGLERAYLAWEIAHSAPGLDPDSRASLEALAAVCVAAMQGGSTRVPADEARLPIALEGVGRLDRRAAVLALLARARRGDPGDPVCAVVGRPGERRPIVLDGDWLSTERMSAIEQAFCDRVRLHVRRATPAGEGPRQETRPEDARAWARAVNAVAGGPPALTGEQKKAVREALSSPLALVTGGPGTGKTTIVVTLLRALSWAGLPMASVAIAAPTGKAAQRLQESIEAGLALAPRDMAEAALAHASPAPQTIHRLLGWSPSAGRFARHENDPLPHRFVVVDEASMVDLYLMDRLLRALRPDARLVLLGDADQLPSIEAGAVFRDLCATLGAARLTTNLRVTRDPAGKGIVDVARAVNAGSVAGVHDALGAPRTSTTEVSFEGVEHLAAAWEVVGDAVLDRWWQAQVPRIASLGVALATTHSLAAGELDEGGRACLEALLAHHQRSRFLCATRAKAIPTSAESINGELLERWRSAVRRAGGLARGSGLCAGVPIIVERNDYERGLFNGDLGIIVRADAGDGLALHAAFKRRGAWTTFPLDSLPEIAPAFAMTVHKAQGSEHDEVVVVLPDSDVALLTREWLYTALTRARRNVLVVGTPELLECAVSRSVERYSGIRGKLRDLNE